MSDDQATTHGPRLVCVVLVNSLQNQLQNPRASDPEESNEAFDRTIRGWLL